MEIPADVHLWSYGTYLNLDNKSKYSITQEKLMQLYAWEIWNIKAQNSCNFCSRLLGISSKSVIINSKASGVTTAVKCQCFNRLIFWRGEDGQHLPLQFFCVTDELWSNRPAGFTWTIPPAREICALQLRKHHLKNSRAFCKLQDRRPELLSNPDWTVTQVPEQGLGCLTSSLSGINLLTQKLLFL